MPPLEPERFLERQLRLQVDSFGVDPTELTGEQLGEFVRWNIVALIDELMEALHHVQGWKPWSELEPTLPPDLRDDYVEELVDAYHFLGNLLLVAGVDDEELTEFYTGKAEVNRERQEAGYAK